jgi:prepilin-type processing-associated H-X9-DG protein
MNQGDNWKLGQEKIPCYTCPSDSPTPLLENWHNPGFFNYVCNAGNTALVDYNGSPVANTATFGLYLTGTTGKEFGRAPFAVWMDAAVTESFPFAYITDGLSNTLGQTEVIQGKSEPPFDGTSTTEYYQDLRGYVYHFVGCYFTTLYTPNSSQPDVVTPWGGVHMYCEPEATGAPCAAGSTSISYITARSRHTGGVNGVLLDGSVRFFPNTTTWIIWQALGTAQGSDNSSL